MQIGFGKLAANKDKYQNLKPRMQINNTKNTLRNIYKWVFFLQNYGKAKKRSIIHKHQKTIY